MRVFNNALVMFAILATGIGAGVKRSEVTNSVYVEFVLDRGESISSNGEITYGFLCTNSPMAKIAIPKREYFLSAELFDSIGGSMPRSKLGESFGSKFRSLTNYSSDHIEKLPALGSNRERARVLRLWPDGAAAEKLPSVENLFQITNSGQYTLRCKFQVFEMIKQGTNYKYNLVEIPSVEIPVHKAK
jgi:hypothetical protein